MLRILFNIGKLFQDYASKKAQSEGLTRHLQMPAGVGWQGSHEAMESPEALIAPLKRGLGGIKTSARSVRVWDRVPMKNMGIEHYFTTL